MRWTSSTRCTAHPFLSVERHRYTDVMSSPLKLMVDWRLCTLVYFLDVRISAATWGHSILLGGHCEKLRFEGTCL